MYSNAYDVNEQLCFDVQAVRLFENKEEIVQFQCRIIAFIGEGSFGKVYRIQAEKIGAFALKIIDADNSHKEVRILQDLIGHANIVQISYFFDTMLRQRQVTCMVLELMPENFDQLIKRHKEKKDSKELTFFNIKVYLYQLISGVQYIHLKGIIHRDLKPNNLLCDSRRGVLKVGDFGCAIHVRSFKKYECRIGSRYYRAPELLLGCSTYTYTVDIWAIGCIMGEIYKGEPLFVGANVRKQLKRITSIIGSIGETDAEEFKCEISSSFTDYKRPITLRKYLPYTVPDIYFDLLEKVLQYRPSKRLNLAQMLMHPLFNELQGAQSLETLFLQRNSLQEKTILHKIENRRELLF